MKRFLSVILCLCLILALGGCGKDGKKTDTITTIAEDNITNAQVILFKDSRGSILFYNSDIERVFARESEDNGYYIEIKMTEDGTKKLADATRRIVGENMKMYISDIPVVSAAVVAEITSGSFILSRHTTQDELLQMFDKLT